MQYSRKDNPCFEGIINKIPLISKHLFKPVKIEGIPGSCFPENKSFYRYRGSLPAPYCINNVTWVLFAKPSTVSRRQVSRLKKIINKIITIDNTKFVIFTIA